MNFFLFAIFLASTVFAAPKLSVPETVVRISIFDLIEATKKEAKPLYQLPVDYGQRVATLILERKKELLECSKDEESKQKKMQLTIAITASGSGKVSFAEEAKSAPEVCMQSILQEISYPKHGFKHQVTVDLPLQLEKRVL